MITFPSRLLMFNQHNNLLRLFTLIFVRQVEWMTAVTLSERKVQKRSQPNVKSGLQLDSHHCPEWTSEHPHFKISGQGPTPLFLDAFGTRPVPCLLGPRPFQNLGSAHVHEIPYKCVNQMAVDFCEYYLLETREWCCALFLFHFNRYWARWLVTGIISIYIGLNTSPMHTPYNQCL